MAATDTPACVDPDLCEWAYHAGDDSVGAPGCWICTTCGNVDFDREPPSDDPEPPS